MIKPQISVIASLDRRARALSALLGEDLAEYFGDLNDHLAKIWDTLEDDKDVIEGLSDTNNSLTNTRINDVIKVLTILSVDHAAADPRLRHLRHELQTSCPLSSHPFGFWITIAVMVVIALGMVLFFKLRRWIYVAVRVRERYWNMTACAQRGPGASGRWRSARCGGVAVAAGNPLIPFLLLIALLPLPWLLTRPAGGPLAARRRDHPAALRHAAVEDRVSRRLSWRLRLLLLAGGQPVRRQRAADADLAGFVRSPLDIWVLLFLGVISFAFVLGLGRDLGSDIIHNYVKLLLAITRLLHGGPDPAHARRHPGGAARADRGRRAGGG